MVNKTVYSKTFNLNFHLIQSFEGHTNSYIPNFYERFSLHQSLVIEGQVMPLVALMQPFPLALPAAGLLSGVFHLLTQ